MFGIDDERIVSFVMLGVAILLVSGLVADRIFGHAGVADYALVGTGVLLLLFGVGVLIVTQYRERRQNKSS